MAKTKIELPRLKKCKHYLYTTAAGQNKGLDEFNLTEGYSFTLPEIEGTTFFIHRTLESVTYIFRESWEVSEVVTGSRIMRDYSTRADAIDATRKFIKEKGVRKIRSRINWVIKKHGTVPEITP